MNGHDRREAAELLHRVLEAVERGDLAADGPTAVAVVRRRPFFGTHVKSGG